MRKLNPRRLAAAAVFLTCASAFAGGQVTSITATAKVRPTDPVPAVAPANFVAARNEFVSFQVVVQADGSGASNVTASLPGLTGPGAIGPEHVMLYREEYLDITTPSFASASKGRYPDALIPDVDETVGEKRNAFPFSVPANESRVIWVDVLVPLGTPAGAYTGAVSVKGDGVDAQVPVTINVLNTELPSTSSVATAFLFHRNLACSVHTGDSECGGEEGSYALRSKYQRLALEHRFTLSNTLTYPSNGDWATFDQRYAPWLEGTAPSRLPGAQVTSIQYHGPREAAQLQTFEQHMAQKGWLSRAYDYTGDEPPYGISFAEAKTRAQLVKQAAPNLRTLLTTTVQAADQNGLSSYLDLIVPVVNHMDGTEAPYVGDQRPAYDQFLGEAGNGLWIYQSCMSHGCAFGTNDPNIKPGTGWPSYMVDASAARNRAMQWVVWLQNASGELYYETALALDTAWDSVYRFAGNGDGTLFYPGLPARIGGTTDVPLPSFRIKQIRLGMQDYEWLKKVADAGDPAFAREVARTLAPTASSVGDDGAAFDTARLKLISRWLELQPKDSGNPPANTLPSPTHPNPQPGDSTAAFNPDEPGAQAGCTVGGPALGGILALVGLSFALRRRR